MQRRYLLKSMSLFLFACKNRLTKRDALEIPKEELAEKPAGVEGDVVGAAPDWEQVTQECAWNNKIDVEKIDQAGESLKETIRFFGEKNHYIVGVNLPFYNHSKKELKEIYLLRKDGTILASAIIDSYLDTDSYKSLYPIIFEHALLKKQEQIFLMYRMTEDKYFLSKSWTVHDEKVFREKLVLREFEVKKHHLYPIFIPTYIPPVEELDVVAGFYSPSSGKSIQGVSSNKDLIITDIAGSILAEQGEAFTDIVSYRIVVAYQLVEGKIFVRKVIRV